MSQNNITDELSHHGIPGQKWGIRRYQNKDGSLTAAGKRRVDKLKDEYTNLTGKKLIKKSSTKGGKVKGKTEELEENKSVKDMSTEELNKKTNRLNAERNYIEAVNSRKALDAQQVSRGKKIVNKIKTEMIEPAVIDVGKQLIKSFLVDQTNKTFNLTGDLKVHTNNKKKN